MKKTNKALAMVVAAMIAMPCGANMAIAADENTSDETIPAIEKTDKPPVIVDENFDTDKQDFLTSETVKQVKVIVPEMENKEIKFKTGTPYLDDDKRIRVPLRDIAEQLGYKVDWYSETGQIVISNSNQWYTFTADDNVVTCKPHFIGTDKNDNGIYAGHMKMDCSPKNIGGVTYIPLRHIANILCQNVVWDTDTLTAELYNLSVISYGHGVVYYDIDESVLK